MTKIFGHRGSAGTHPENTMAGYKEAIRVGVDGIEIDVQLTKDGKIAVIHDETVERVTNGKGFVKDYTLDELKQLDAGSYFMKKYHEESIPELKEVLQLVKESGILVNIEFKNVLLDYPYLEEKVLAEVERLNLKKNTIISSFNHLSLHKTRQLDSEIDIGLLFAEKMLRPWEYAEKVGATSLHPNKYSMTEELSHYVDVQNMPVRLYTVNDEKQMETFIQMGCDTIMTDFPEKAIALRKRLK